MCVCGAQSRFGLAPAKASHHLKMLREAGLGRGAGAYLSSLPLPLAVSASTRLTSRALVRLSQCGQVSVL